MKFVIEQIAIAPARPQLAKLLLKDMGLTDSWVEDAVVATGQVCKEMDVTNKANLSFAYSEGKLEFEVLSYERGMNWVDEATKHKRNVVSHIGMHCTWEDLSRWKHFFAERCIAIAQEVFTESHTNPFLLETGRRYHYCIFDTRSILGVDVKFIVRNDPQT